MSGIPALTNASVFRYVCTVVVERNGPQCKFTHGSVFVSDWTMGGVRTHM